MSNRSRDTTIFFIFRDNGLCQLGSFYSIVRKIVIEIVLEIVIEIVIEIGRLGSTVQKIVIKKGHVLCDWQEIKLTLQVKCFP